MFAIRTLKRKRYSTYILKENKVHNIYKHSHRLTDGKRKREMLLKSEKRFAKRGWKSNVSNFHNASKNNLEEGRSVEYI